MGSDGGRNVKRCWKLTGRLIERVGIGLGSRWMDGECEKREGRNRGKDRKWEMRGKRKGEEWIDSDWIGLGEIWWFTAHPSTRGFFLEHARVCCSFFFSVFILTATFEGEEHHQQEFKREREKEKWKENRHHHHRYNDHHHHLTSWRCFRFNCCRLLLLFVVCYCTRGLVCVAITICDCLARVGSLWRMKCVLSVR